MLSRVLAVPVLLLLTHATATAASPVDEGAVTAERGFVLNGSGLATPRSEDGPNFALLRLGVENAGFASEAAPAPTASLLSAARNADLPATLKPRPRAFEYSDGYRTRLKIHKYASFATLPVFAAQFAVGQKLYNGNGSDSTRSLHSTLAATTGVLFGVNTITGVWNWREGRKDPNHHKKKMLHGMLMLVADAGFVATGALAPSGRRESGETGISPATHRGIALTSMGIATVGYAIMLFHH
jgi:hypothetical protein